MAAIAMCDDAGAGLELAFGRGPDESGDAAPLPDHIAAFDDGESSPDEEAQWNREDERRRRVEETTILQTANAFVHLAHSWIRERREDLRVRDDIVREAFEVAAHDCLFIGVKLHRALDGKDRHGTEDGGDDDAVQNDWNGSAKIALIAIVRSAEAWSVLASATDEDTPAVLAAHLKDLRTEVERTFPDAWRFRRPGFDA
jgi:hypothetical protein